MAPVTTKSGTKATMDTTATTRTRAPVTVRNTGDTAASTSPSKTRTKDQTATTVPATGTKGKSRPTAATATLKTGKAKEVTAAPSRSKGDLPVEGRPRKSADGALAAVGKPLKTARTGKESAEPRSNPGTDNTNSAAVASGTAETDPGATMPVTGDGTQPTVPDKKVKTKRKSPDKKTIQPDFKTADTATHTSTTDTKATKPHAATTSKAVTAATGPIAPSTVDEPFDRKTADRNIDWIGREIKRIAKDKPLATKLKDILTTLDREVYTLAGYPSSAAVGTGTSTSDHSSSTQKKPPGPKTTPARAAKVRPDITARSAPKSGSTEAVTTSAGTPSTRPSTGKPSRNPSTKGEPLQSRTESKAKPRTKSKAKPGAKASAAKPKP